MTYNNPVIKGFYPDPSVCFHDGKYYLVCSSFQYFPGVPLFESDDLVNWKQLGYVLTRSSQVMLDKINSSGGVFAPTIRCNNGRFYMVTTNDTTHQNFYVWTDDIHGEWSEPVYVDQGGIDPSLYFEDGRTYFMSNGADDNGVGGVVQCEIDIATGKKLSPSRCIWQGSGGRYLESPHLYKINGTYYLMAAEGGTEYGHMITCARSGSVWGPFESNPHNPVLTNRNKAPFIIQGIGHGDLIQDRQGGWHVLSLGFRQQHIWRPYHHLGREVFLTPVQFGGDGWFTCGNDGTTDKTYEMAGDHTQNEQRLFTFENTDWNIEWCYMRKPRPENYELKSGSALLHGTDITLDDVDSPTFIAMRQRDFHMEMKCSVRISGGNGAAGGLTVFITENEHYDLFLEKDGDGCSAVLMLNIGGIKHRQNAVKINGDSAQLIIRADCFGYKFFAVQDGAETQLGYGSTKYLSSEVAEGFTGVMTGLYAVKGDAEFTGFSCEYFEAE